MLVGFRRFISVDAAFLSSCVRRLLSTTSDRPKATSLQRTVPFAAASLCFGLVLGCGGGGSTSSTPPPPSGPSNLTYSQASITAAVGQFISDTSTVTGTVTSYTVDDTLPNGVTLNSKTGTISGIPTETGSQAYTISGSNANGTTTAQINFDVIAPAAGAPSNLSYSPNLFNASVGQITGSVGQPITPFMPYFAGTASSFSVTPALPAGLTLSTATGTITGTPTAAVAQATYVVTATNTTSNTSCYVSITVIQAPKTLLDLGQSGAIAALQFVGDSLLSTDATGHWVLWKYSTGANLANGDGNQGFAAYTYYTPNPISLAGQVAVIGLGNGLEVLSSSSGQFVSLIAYPGLNPNLPQILQGSQAPPVYFPWWRLASDGSYICIGSTSGLFVYSPTGQLVTSKTGDYSAAQAFAAPGNVLVAQGPAGQNVIETVSAMNGASSASPTFSGQFYAWFTDGGMFLAAQGNTVWEYSNAGVQEGLVALPTVAGLTGQGNWIWTDANPLEIYAIGSDTPAATFPGDRAVASGSAIIMSPFGAGQVSVVDLSGSTPTIATYTIPIADLNDYAATSATQWVAGNEWGAIFDGASLSTTPRFLGYGTAWSIAGSATEAAASTASGEILVFEPAQSTEQPTLNFSASSVALSSDGTVLGAMADANDAQYETDRTLNFYSLPSTNPIGTFPSSTLDTSTLTSFTLAQSGTNIGQVFYNSGSNSYSRQVTPIAGGTPIWSDTGSSNAILLSPDGTLVAANNYNTSVTPGPAATTNIYKNGALVTAIPGIVVGWIDNDRMLVNQFVNTMSGTAFSGSVIYSAEGSQLATPPLPQLNSIQTVTSDSVYDPTKNTIYSLTTGLPVWTGTLPISANPNLPLGAVVGSSVVYQSNHNLIIETPPAS